MDSRKNKMYKPLRAFIFRMAVLTVACLFLSGCKEKPGKDLTVKVSVQDTKGLRITSENPVTVSLGGTAEFSYTLSEGAELLKVEGAEYRSGVIRMTDVRFPETLLPEVLCADDKDPESTWILRYDPNGGVNRQSGNGDVLTTTFSREFYHCPNALNDNRSFTREGYALLGYNTAADGSGTYYGPGWNVLMPESGVIDLYCVWEKYAPEADFEYQIKKNEATITRYKGKDSFVVIPELLGGKKVTAIAEKAFNNISQIKTLMLTKNLRTIEDKAFRNLKNLTTVYFADTVTELSDDFISGSPAFSTLYMLAVRDPFYREDRYGTYGVKFGRLITAESPKLVLVSGSNGTYGIDSAALEEKLAAAGYPVHMVNYGQIAGNATAFNIEVISHFMNEGDFLLHMPEISASHQYGDNSFSSPMWEMSESCYNVFSYVDIRHYTEVFSSFATFNKARAEGRLKYSYEIHSDLVNPYGDYSASKEGTDPETAALLDSYDAAGGVGTRSLTSAAKTIKNSTYRKELNRVFDMVAERKAKVLFIFGSLARISLKAPDQVTDGEEQRQYEASVDNFLHCERIAPFSSSLFERQYIYNSVQHLNNDGRVIRTERVAEDLIRYFRGGGYGL